MPVQLKLLTTSVFAVSLKTMTVVSSSEMSTDFQLPDSVLLPLVSVLIRTQGRASLARAVQSVHQQGLGSFRLELLVVNAAGKPLPSLELPETASLITQVLNPGKDLGRSQAANALLETATGKYALFLDDDDWLLPGHLTKLVAQLQARPQLVGAYSDVQCVTVDASAQELTPLPESEAIGHLYAQDFDSVALQLQNFLPIHAVLFRMDKAHQIPVCQFTPELELFEDWDFWLQLACRGPFERVPGVSAMYALSSETGSRHAELSNVKREQMLTLFGARQLGRWRAEDVAALVIHEASRIQTLTAQRQVAEQVKSQLEEAVQGREELFIHAEKLKQQVNDVQLEYLQHLKQHHAFLQQQTVERNNYQLERNNYQLERNSYQEERNSYHEERKSHHEERKSYHEERKIERNNLQLERNKFQVERASFKVEYDSLVSTVVQLQAEKNVIQQSLQETAAYSQLQQAEINTLSHLRLEHLEAIKVLQQSRSWRLMHPLRQVGSVARKLPGQAFMRFAHNVLRAVRQDVAQKGVAGFVQRLPYYLKHRRTYVSLLARKVPAHDGATFAATPAPLRNVRLHPDLTGGGPVIDAKVSVVIPTLNAGSEFAWMLRKLRAQCGVREIEIVVVDSGSTDGTVQAASNAEAIVVEILPSEFSHSYARNLGADHASGDYLLFMVQDAYPIGDYWMQGMLAYLQDHAGEGLAAASCAEYSRSDSDMMYDSMIHTHYTFLGCLEYDRIGQFTGDDHMALRSQGQLSDVSCLIGRSCFQEFRYRGNYAEDLDLGIRLIKNGKKVAMLASVKVIHSHNRPAYYYLKRSFVDVIFLVGLFDDFTYPRCASLTGLVVGIQATARVVSSWLQTQPPALMPEKPEQVASNTFSRGSLQAQIDHWITTSRKNLSAPHLLMLNAVSNEALALGDQRLDAFIASMPAHYLKQQQTAVMAASLDNAGREEARHFADMFIARLDHFKRFAAEVYGPQDALLTRELGDVVRKTFAAAAGSALAFYCLAHPLDTPASGAEALEANADRVAARQLHHDLAAGV